MSRGWLELESDPGLFTLLVEDFGVKGVQVDDIYDLQTVADLTGCSRFLFSNGHAVLSRDVYGFIFLFRWNEDKRSRKKVTNGEELFVDDEQILNNMFFARQVVPDSCATHALLSVLLNCSVDEASLGETLRTLKVSCKNLSAEDKGQAIGNMPDIASAHNAHARPDMLKQPERTQGVPAARGKGETYHYVSYIPIAGHLYELDGLKPYPMDHGELRPAQPWTAKFHEVISERIRVAGNDIMFNLMAVVPDKRQYLSESLDILKQNCQLVLETLQQVVDVKETVQSLLPSSTFPSPVENPQTPAASHEPGKVLPASDRPHPPAAPPPPVAPLPPAAPPPSASVPVAAVASATTDHWRMPPPPLPQQHCGTGAAAVSAAVAGASFTVIGRARASGPVMLPPPPPPVAALPQLQAAAAVWKWPPALECHTYSKPPPCDPDYMCLPTPDALSSSAVAAAAVNGCLVDGACVAPSGASPDECRPRCDAAGMGHRQSASVKDIETAVVAYLSPAAPVSSSPDAGELLGARAIAQPATPTPPGSSSSCPSQAIDSIDATRPLLLTRAASSIATAGGMPSLMPVAGLLAAKMNSAVKSAPSSLSWPLQDPAVRDCPLPGAAVSTAALHQLGSGDSNSIQKQHHQQASTLGAGQEACSAICDVPPVGAMGLTAKGLVVLSKKIESQLSEYENRLKEENDQRKKYKIDDCRRTHDYEPFIESFIRLLSAKRLLPYLAEQHGLIKHHKKRRRGRPSHLVSGGGATASASGCSVLDSDSTCADGGLSNGTAAVAGATTTSAEAATVAAVRSSNGRGRGSTAAVGGGCVDVADKTSLKGRKRKKLT